MKAGGFSLGGEQSGHVIMLDHATTGDGAAHRAAAAGPGGRDRQAAGRAGRGDGPAAAGAASTCATSTAPASAPACRCRRRSGPPRPSWAATGRVLLRPSGTEPRRTRDGRGDREGAGRRGRRAAGRRRPGRAHPLAAAAGARPVFPIGRRNGLQTPQTSPILRKRAVRYRVGKAGARALSPAGARRTVKNGGHRRGHEGSAGFGTRSRGGLCRRRAGDDGPGRYPAVARPRRDRGSRAGGEPSDWSRTGCRGGVATAGEPTSTATPRKKKKKRNIISWILSLGPGAPIGPPEFTAYRELQRRRCGTVFDRLGDCSSRRRPCTAARRGPAWPPSRTAPGCGVAPSPRYAAVKPARGRAQLHGRRRARAAEAARHPAPQAPEPAVPAGARHGLPGATVPDDRRGPAGPGDRGNGGAAVRRLPGRPGVRRAGRRQLRLERRRRRGGHQHRRPADHDARGAAARGVLDRLPRRARRAGLGSRRRPVHLRGTDVGAPVPFACPPPSDT